MDIIELKSILNSIIASLAAVPMLNKQTSVWDEKKKNDFKNMLVKSIEQFLISKAKQNDGTILSESAFYQYLENHKPCEDIIQYVLNPNQSNLLRNDFISGVNEKAIAGVNRILSQAGKPKLNGTDQSLIQHYFLSFLKMVDEKSNSQLSFEQMRMINAIKQLQSPSHAQNEEKRTVLNQSCQYDRLLEALKAGYLEEKEKNPSYDGIGVSDEILIKGSILENCHVMGGNRDIDDIPMPLPDIIERSWSISGEPVKYISLYGIGGIGKTISLLSLAIGTSIVYIPLRRLHTSATPIRHYIETVTLHHDTTLMKDLFSMCEQSSSEKPALLLVLDGVNELDNALKNVVMREVKTDWSGMRSIQILFASRNNTVSELQSEFHAPLQVHADSLDRNTIESFLKQNNIKLPPPQDNLWNVIDTPLLLILFAKFEAFKQKYQHTTGNWRENKNPGSIIWNFIQSESYLQDQTETGNYDYCVAAEFVAPYICYEMAKNNQFIISHRNFIAYTNSACDLYEAHSKDNRLPSHIQEMKYQNGSDAISRDNMYNLQVKTLCLFYDNDGQVQLVHQHFRDCLAAIYLYNLAEASTDEVIPVEWSLPFDQYIMGFVANLLETEPQFSDKENVWAKLWELHRKAPNHDTMFILKMLELYRMAYGNKADSINFSGLDLSNVPLTNLDLRNSKGHFNGSKLSSDTFFGKGHRMNVSSISWSPNGKHYLSASYDCSIRIWDRCSEKNTVLKRFHQHYIRCAKWHPTRNNIIASAGDDRELCVWQYNSKTARWKPEIKGTCAHWIRCMAWSHDGRAIACGDEEGTVKLFYQKADPIELSKVHQNRVIFADWNPGSFGILATADKSALICIWDVREKKPMCTISANGNEITSLNWLNDHIIAVSTRDELRLLDWNHLKEMTGDIKLAAAPLAAGPLRRNDISAVAIEHSDTQGDKIALFHNNTVEMQAGFTVDNGYQMAAIGIHGLLDYSKQRVVSACWNRGATELICGFRDGTVCRIAIDVVEENREQITSALLGDKCPNTARCSNWSEDGSRLAAGYDDGSIRIWDIASKRCINIIEGHMDSVKCVAWMNDNTHLVSGSDDRTVRLWDTTCLNESEACIASHNVHTDSVNAVICLKDGRIVSGSDDCSLALWEKKADTQIMLPTRHSKGIYSLSVSPDEHFLVSGGNDRTIVLWDLLTLDSIQIVESGHSEPIRTILWTEDGNEIITTSNDGEIISHRFDKEAQKITGVPALFPDRHTDFIYGAALSRNSQFLVSGTTDALIGIWDLQQKNRLEVKTEHSSFVWNVSASPVINGRCYAASASSDGTILIWDVTNASSIRRKSVAEYISIPYINLLDCDFSGAIIQESKLSEILRMNGASYHTGKKSKNHARARNIETARLASDRNGRTKKDHKGNQ